MGYWHQTRSLELLHLNVTFRAELVDLHASKGSNLPVWFKEKCHVTGEVSFSLVLNSKTNRELHEVPPTGAALPKSTLAVSSADLYLLCRDPQHEDSPTSFLRRAGPATQCAHISQTRVRRQEALSRASTFNRQGLGAQESGAGEGPGPANAALSRHGASRLWSGNRPHVCLSPHKPKTWRCQMDLSGEFPFVLTPWQKFKTNFRGRGWREDSYC